MTIFDFQIGNAYIDDETQDSGTVDYLWSHAMVSDEVREGITLNCNFSPSVNVSEACQTYIDQIDIGDNYGYEIYAPSCDPQKGSFSVFFFSQSFYSNYYSLELNCSLVLLFFLKITFA